jgi:hypothetical protein
VKDYKAAIPRTIFGLAAVTMTTFTLAVLVFLPAEIDASELGTASGVVTAATAGANALATGSDLDSVRQAASAAFCATVKLVNAGLHNT